MLTTITLEWAADYASRIQVANSIKFPFTIGRKKNWGGIDSTTIVRDEEEFFNAYKEYNDHPRCVGIFLIKDDGTTVSI